MFRSISLASLTILLGWGVGCSSTDASPDKPDASDDSHSSVDASDEAPSTTDASKDVATDTPLTPDVIDAPETPLGVYPIRDLDPAGPTDDLEPAFSFFEKANVYAFGETVHTSEGYAQARYRSIRYLVENKGVRAVAFESPWGPAEATRAYVEHGKGSLQKARLGLTFVAWASKASTELLQFLREFNINHPSDPVTVFGFDIQNPAFDGSYVRAFFDKAAPEDKAVASALDICLGAKFSSYDEVLLDPVDGPIYESTQQLSQERHEACLEAVENAREFMNANEVQLTSKSSEEEFKLTQFALRAIAANSSVFFYYDSDMTASYEARDEGMAEGFMLHHQLRAPGKPAAIIAHNSHIMRRRQNLTAPGWEWKSMGSWLDEWLGEAYAPVGLFAYRVDYKWDGSTLTEVPARNGLLHIERPLNELGLPFLMLDLTHNEVLTPGVEYEFSYFEKGIPLEHFHAAFFLQYSPPYENP